MEIIQSPYRLNRIQAQAHLQGYEGGFHIAQDTTLTSAPAQTYVYKSRELVPFKGRLLFDFF